MEQNQSKEKLGISVWMYAIVCGLCSLGSVVIAVTTILRVEILSCIIFLLFCAPVFGFVSVQFGWKPIKNRKKA